MTGAERIFYSVLYNTGSRRLGWLKKATWKNVYNMFSWYELIPLIKLGL